MLNQTNTNNYDYYLLPHNILAEEIIIGYCISKTISPTYISINYIDSNLFTLEKHKIIHLYYLQIHNRHTESNEESNLAKLINILWSKQLLARIGGIKQIINLIQKSTAISISLTENIYFQYFIDILYYNYSKRLLIQYSHSILQLSHHPISTEYIYSQSKKYLQKIANIIKIQEYSYCNNLVKQFLLNFHTKNYEQNRPYILSGFIELDLLTQGFKLGDLIIIAGRPSMGKTSLAINIAHYVLLQLQVSIYIFSLEMSKQEILDKIISIESNIKYKNVQNKIIKTHEWDTLQNTCQRILKSNLHIDDNNNASIEYIKYQTKKYQTKKKILLS